jgi:hypothetical protein
MLLDMASLCANGCVQFRRSRFARHLRAFSPTSPPRDHIPQHGAQATNHNRGTEAHACPLDRLVQTLIQMISLTSRPHHPKHGLCVVHSGR